MKSYKMMFVLLACQVVLPVHAALVAWQATDVDVNYIYTTAPGYSLALFDVGDFDGSRSAPLLLNAATAADSISITAGTTNFNAISRVTNNSITLFNDDQFVLAITDGTDWFEPLSWFELAANSNIYSVNFAFGSVTSIDAAPAVVPAPAAVWLFGSGLLGLFAVLRKKVRF